MATTFQRLCAAETSLDPRQYTIETGTTRPVLCCPACSHRWELPPGISWDAVGRTNYCVTCPADACGWWDYAVLDSIWEEP
jgi:hypothetical protein